MIECIFLTIKIAQALKPVPEKPDFALQVLQTAFTQVPHAFYIIMAFLKRFFLS